MLLSGKADVESCFPKVGSAELQGESKEALQYKKEERKTLSRARFQDSICFRVEFHDFPHSVGRYTG